MCRSVVDAARAVVCREGRPAIHYSTADVFWRELARICSQRKNHQSRHVFRVHFGRGIVTDRPTWR